jgi:glycopeptide antibiotics resistance protein
VTTKAAWSDRHVCVVAAAACAAIVVYGSLLPFDIQVRGSIDPGHWPEHIRFTTSRAGSATDLLVNLATGVPLGFFLMGALRSGRPWSSVGALVGLLVVGCSSGMLAVIVELLQLLCPTRISSWQDVLGQVLGASSGAVAWTLAGPAITAWLRRMPTDDEPFGFATRLLQLYVPIYLFMQLGSPDTELPDRGIIPLPFAVMAFSVPLVRNYVGTALLNVPIGALAVLARVTRRSRPVVADPVLAGLSAVIAIEITQSLIWSRHADVWNMLAGLVGVVFGSVAARKWVGRNAGEHRGVSVSLDRRLLLIAVGGWILILIAELLYPYDFRLKLEVLRARIPYIPLLPFASYYPSFSSIPFNGLREALRRFLLGVPLGLLLRMAWPVAGEQSVRRLQALAIAGLATILFVGIAVAEIFIPSGYPDITEVVLGVAGAVLGVQLVQSSSVRMTGGEGCGIALSKGEKETVE